MKRSQLFLFVFALILGVTTLNGCKKCTETGDVTIDATLQYFTITYTEPDGTNYVDSIFNNSNVSVLYADRYQNNPQYIPLNYTEDFSDGMIGPIPYTTVPDEALIGVPYNSEFIIKRDTYGWDTIRIEFVAQVDECKEFWAEISYYLNGDLVDAFQDEEIANFNIVIP
jgi:hypothetical protein